MKIRFQNRTSGERIRHLMDNKNVKNAPNLVKEMVKAGILEKKKYEGDFMRYTADTINKHLADKQLPDRKWIDLYCDFFDCSADYLMGYIDEPTPETTDICGQTGLSETSVNKLIRKKKRNRMYSRILSWLIEHDTFDTIISRIDGFLQVKWLQAASASEGHPDKKLDKELTKEEERLFFISHEFTNVVQDIAKKEIY